MGKRTDDLQRQVDEMKAEIEALRQQVQALAFPISPAPWVNPFPNTQPWTPNVPYWPQPNIYWCDASGGIC